MHNNKPKIILFLYNRLFDQVNQSNFWLYIRDYLEDENNPYKFHVISYEDPAYPLTQEQKNLLDKWKKKGLEWTPLPWHQGKELSKKFIDLFNGFLVVTKLRFKGYRYIITLASIAGTYAYVYSVPLRLRLFMYSFEPHSEYGLDSKWWTEESLQYKIMHYLEEMSAKSAAIVASGTRFMKERLENEWNSNAKFIKLPTAANDQKFIYNEKDRQEVRKQFNIPENAWLLFYPGKFGNLYYREEFVWMYRWLKEDEDRFHLLVVTPQTDEEVISIMNEASLSPDSYTIAHSDYIDIHKYFSAADFAIVSVPPGPSKKFTSSIKVGEYLCSGLPFLVPRGVSEDYIYAEEKHVGVVVNDFSKEEVKKALPSIIEYCSKDKDILRKHCRKIGLEYRGFSRLKQRFKDAMKYLTEMN